MQTELLRPVASGLVSSDRIQRLVADFLAGRKATTLRTYSQGLADFAQFMLGASAGSAVGAEDAALTGATAVNDAAQRLLALSHGEANHLVLNYRADMVSRGLSANTINNRLAAVRSLVKLARTLGLVGWTLDIANVKAKPYRDTTGCGHGGYRMLVAELERDGRPKAIRDLAIVRLLFDRALRRGEVVGLDLDHVDLERERIAVLTKGASEREWLTIAEPTKAALASWIELRGQQPGALFTNLDRAKKGSGRITGEAVRALLARLGDKTGQRVRPHGLRHASITRALDISGGNIARVQKFSRHASPATVMVYDDNRADVGGELTKLVAGE
jgi:integrase/recombinase XerC